jgi:hypothetical protein
MEVEKEKSVFVVTPSANLQEYLAHVEHANPEWSTDSPVTEPPTSTSSTSFPTLSTDPFLVPNEHSTLPVLALIEQSTTPLERAFATFEEISTEALTTKTEVAITETSTTTTTEAQTTKKDSSEESSLSSSSERFSASKESSEVSEKESVTKIAPPTTIDTISEIDVRSSASVEASTTTTEVITTSTTQASTTTFPPKIQEAIESIGRSLEDSEDDFVLNTYISTASTGKISSTTTESIPVPSTAQEVKKESSTMTPPPSTSAAEVSSETATSVADQTSTSSVADETTPTVPGPSPTEFEKLLTTLKEYAAQTEVLTSTSLPNLSIESLPSIEIKTEFMNFTISAVTQPQDEPKPIQKRSVSDADLIPRYFKHIGAAKEKGCAYNGQSFKLGEVIKTDNECLKCFCEYAPIGICVLKEKCNF